MILKLNNKIYALPKHIGGDYLHQIVDSCNNTEQFDTSTQSILCMLKHGEYNNEKVITTLIDPVEQYARAIVSCVDHMLPEKYDVDTKKDLGRSILHGIVCSYKDLFQDGVDYSFSNKSLFRPAVFEQLVWSALGVDMEFLEHDKVVPHCKQTFYAWNRSSFNNMHYVKKNVDTDLGNYFITYLQGELYKQHATIPNFNDWMSFYVRMYNDWACKDLDKQTRTLEAQRLIRCLVEETDYLEKCPSDISYFLILKNTFDVFAELDINTEVSYLCDTEFFNSLTKQFNWISNK